MVCCSVLQCAAVCCNSALQCVAVRCSVLQCVAVRCSVSHLYPPHARGQHRPFWIVSNSTTHRPTLCPAHAVHVYERDWVNERKRESEGESERARERGRKRERKREKERERERERERVCVCVCVRVCASVGVCACLSNFTTRQLILCPARAVCVRERVRVSE